MTVAAKAASTRLHLETLESRLTPAAGRFAVGTDGGTVALVRVYDGTTGILVRTVQPYGAFTGAVHVVMADLNGDAFPELITAAGAGGGPHVKVFNGGDFRELTSFYAFDPRFNGGVNITTGDFNVDGVPDLVVAAGPGGGPHVRILNGGALTVQLGGFYAFDTNFFGGVSVAAADISADGRPEIIVGQQTKGSLVRAYNFSPFSLIRNFDAFPGFTGGVSVAGIDVTNDGIPEIVAGANAGGGPHVKAFFGGTNTVIQSFYAFDPSQKGGTRLATADTNKDGRLELVIGGGAVFGNQAGTVLKIVNTLRIGDRNGNGTLADTALTGTFAGLVYGILIPFPGYGGALNVG